ncbi:polyprenyl synthetase [Streptomyces virginiae]|uniref:polyprenyl synthetase n=1 Tax=Streptomyces virginiae TaxID=1961 RepID=UPI0036B789A4
MTQDAGRSGGPMGPEGPEGRAVLLVAGLADLAATTLGSALGVVSGLLRRSDAAELASEAEQDLMARGRLALDRYAAVPPAHLELLARHVTARESNGV